MNNAMDNAMDAPVNTRWDIVIAGGGLSGLAMAVELAQPRFAHLKILLVERRTAYQRDRTWSFWSDGSHALAHLERAAWSRWRVAHDGSEAVCGGGPSSYRTIDADAFYADALAKIAACPHIEMRLSSAVASAGSDWPCRVVLADGERLQTSLLIDARPGTTAAPPALAQHFAGWEIETDVDLFDPVTLDLMDFKPAHDGLHFFYVLPYGPRRALLETTWVSAPGLHHDYAAQLERYIARRWGNPVYRTVYEEHGRLPLDPVAAGPMHGPIVTVGRAAGTLRPSTGFAFLETLAHCARLARQIEQCSFPMTGDVSRRALRPFRRAAVDLWMDRLFLRVLAADWRAAPSLFVMMFRHTPPNRLIRFLSGHASWRDRAAVVASLPKRRFLHALVRPRDPRGVLVAGASAGAGAGSGSGSGK
jgi:lycopene beta-cyclase